MTYIKVFVCKSISYTRTNKFTNMSVRIITIKTRIIINNHKFLFCFFVISTKLTYSSSKFVLIIILFIYNYNYAYKCTNMMKTVKTYSYFKWIIIVLYVIDQ